MNILIIGNGGREHALAFKAAQSPKIEKVFVAPGNAGTNAETKVENIAISATQVSRLVNFAKTQNIALTLVGPEAPLALGIVDAFEKANLPCFGPSKKAAQLESSKEFAKDFMKRHNIPTARYQSFTDANQAKGYLADKTYPIVIKADGLAAGKGVIIAEDKTTAIKTIDDMLCGNQFGEAGHVIVIEEFLQGEEASFIVVSDGEHIVPLVSSQDHKARDDGDKGPNTGGMGAYSPAPVVTKKVEDIVLETIIKPTICGMKQEGMAFRGFLYAGLMIDANGQPKVLEFNCRLGDPEAQVLLARLESDLVELCEKTVTKSLKDYEIKWTSKVALGVVMASGGYPYDYVKGYKIEGLNLNQPQTKVFHAGTAQHEGKVFNAGGRVLCVTALADTLKEAQKKAYERVKTIHWNQCFYRKDIGHKAL